MNTLERYCIASTRKPTANSSFKNKGERINLAQSIFIEQQEVNGTEVFQIPLLLKAEKR
jgi:hypothetical protein